MDSLSTNNKLLKRIWKLLPSLLLILLIIAIVVLSSNISSESERLKADKMEALNKERPSLNVVVLDVNPKPIRDRLNLPAQVEPWVELKILSEVSGKIVEIQAGEGDFVNKGDVIARIDSRDYENDLAAVRAEYDLANSELARSKNLYNEQLITKSQYDSDMTRVNKLDAELKNAELKLERCSIKAPMSGIINHADAEEGLYLNVQDPVAVILDISRVKACVGIPESDVDEVRKITSFNISIDALGDKIVRGEKHFLSRSPESFAHLYRLEIEIPNPDGSILPGMFARANIVKREVTDSISVPLYSVITRVDDKFVYVEKAGKAHLRMVETGILEGWQIQISKGLSKGDRVIVVGHRSVDEGQAVNVVRNVSDPEELFQ